MELFELTEGPSLLRAGVAVGHDCARARVIRATISHGNHDPESVFIMVDGIEVLNLAEFTYFFRGKIEHSTSYFSYFGMPGHIEVFGVWSDRLKKGWICNERGIENYDINMLVEEIMSTYAPGNNIPGERSKEYGDFCSRVSKVWPDMLVDKSMIEKLAQFWVMADPVGAVKWHQVWLARKERAKK